MVVLVFLARLVLVVVFLCWSSFCCYGFSIARMRQYLYFDYVQLSPQHVFCAFDISIVSIYVPINQICEYLLSNKMELLSQLFLHMILECLICFCI